MTEIGDRKLSDIVTPPPEPLKRGDMVVWRNTPDAEWEIIKLEPNGTAVIWHSNTRSARVCNLDRLRRT